MKNLKELFDMIFKALGIVIMILVLVFAVIVVKSCSHSVKMMDEKNGETPKYRSYR